MKPLLNLSDTKLIRKCLSMLHGVGLLMMFFIIVVMILTIGINVFEYELNIRTWWGNGNSRDTWVIIYLWTVQLILMKMTGMIADMYYQAAAGIVLSIKVVLAYVVSVGMIMLGNAALTIFLIWEW